MLCVSYDTQDAHCVRLSETLTLIHKANRPSYSFPYYRESYFIIHLQLHHLFLIQLCTDVQELTKLP